MKITDVKIRKVFSEGPMKAVVSVTVENQLAIHDIKIIHAQDRDFLVMPSKKNPDGSFRDIAHPITAEFRSEMEQAILKAYYDFLNDLTAEPKNTEEENNEE